MQPWFDEARGGERFDEARGGERFDDARGGERFEESHNIFISSCMSTKLQVL